MPLATPALKHLCDLTVFVAQPVDAGFVQGTHSQGQRRIIPITGGTVRGTLQGVVLPGGADFQLVLDKTTAQLDARYVLLLDDGSHVYVHNRALRRASADDMARLVRGETVAPERVYFRCNPTFEVESAVLHWMTRCLFIGTGARYPDRVEMGFYEIL